jgi:hypothetical protein
MSEQDGFPAQSSRIPGTITAAFILMCVGGGLQALGVILNLVNHVSSSSLAGLATAALWFRVAFECRSGKRTARTIASVLFGIFTVMVLVVIAYAGHLFGGTATAVVIALTVFNWLIALSAFLLLWVPASRAFFSSDYPRF